MAKANPKGSLQPPLSKRRAKRMHMNNGPPTKASKGIKYHPLTGSKRAGERKPPSSTDRQGMCYSGACAGDRPSEYGG